MENQFVTYEVALKLKELGFNEECLAYFRNDKYQDLICTCENVMDGNFIVNHYSDDINAPLWQQVIDWFREMHCIFIEIKVNNYFDTFAKNYSYKANCKVFKNGEIDITVLVRDVQNNHIFYSYYETRKQAILKAIELCQNKK